MLIVCCTLAAPLAGCGSEPSPHPETATTAQTQPVTAAPRPRRPHFNGRLLPNPWKRPPRSSIRPHKGFQTARVIVHDVKRGHGSPIRVNDHVYMDFIEANYVTGSEFDWTWRQNPPGGKILTPVDKRLRGLVIGMKGMRPGGRRRIIVPRNLTGIETDHAEFHKIIYWDVVLRGYFARGCRPEGESCRLEPT